MSAFYFEICYQTTDKLGVPYSYIAICLLFTPNYPGTALCRCILVMVKNVGALMMENARLVCNRCIAVQTFTVKLWCSAAWNKIHALSYFIHIKGIHVDHYDFWSTSILHRMPSGSLYIPWAKYYSHHLIILEYISQLANIATHVWKTRIFRALHLRNVWLPAVSHWRHKLIRWWPLAGVGDVWYYEYKNWSWFIGYAMMRLCYKHMPGHKSPAAVEHHRWIKRKVQM